MNVVEHISISLFLQELKKKQGLKLYDEYTYKFSYYLNVATIQIFPQMLDILHCRLSSDFSLRNLYE